MDAKLMACYTQQYAAGNGLRSPNLTELMSADRILVQKIYQLVNEENWNLDDALHEYSTVRHHIDDADVDGEEHPQPVHHRGDHRGDR